MRMVDYFLNVSDKKIEKYIVRVGGSHHDPNKIFTDAPVCLQDDGFIDLGKNVEVSGDDIIMS